MNGSGFNGLWFDKHHHNHNNHNSSTYDSKILRSLISIIVIATVTMPAMMIYALRCGVQPELQL